MKRTAFLPEGIGRFEIDRDAVVMEPNGVIALGLLPGDESLANVPLYPLEASLDWWAVAAAPRGHDAKGVAALRGTRRRTCRCRRPRTPRSSLPKVRPAVLRDGDRRVPARLAAEKTPRANVLLLNEARDPQLVGQDAELAGVSEAAAVAPGAGRSLRRSPAPRAASGSASRGSRPAAARSCRSECTERYCRPSCARPPQPQPSFVRFANTSPVSGWTPPTATSAEVPPSCAETRSGSAGASAP